VQSPSLDKLHSFIIAAKSASYVGNGAKSLSYRPDSHDLQYQQADFAYLDSYFGGSNFIGQELVYYQKKAIWAMNYHGYLLDSAVTAADMGRVIQESLSKMYLENRFLGGFEYILENYKYIDSNQGDISRFTGKEWIMFEDKKVYELVYHGGLVKE